MSIIGEEVFTRQEIQEFSRLYEMIVKSHKSCNGKGLQYTGEDFEHCKCLSAYDYMRVLTYSRVPRRHWDVSAQAYKNVKITRQMFNVENNIDLFFKDISGRVLIQKGQPSSGKTRSLSMFCKMAILNQIPVCYVTADEIIQFMRKEDEYVMYLERLKNSKLVIIDEFFQVPMYSWSYSLLAKFLRSVVDSGIGLIISIGFEDVSKDLESIFRIVERFGIEIVIEFLDKAVYIGENNWNESVFVSEAVHYEKNFRKLHRSNRIGDK